MKERLIQLQLARPDQSPTFKEKLKFSKCNFRL